MAEIFWHNLDFREIAKTLRVDIENGLSEKEVELRQREFGKNILPEEKPLPRLKIFLDQFRNPLVFILIIAGIATVFLKDFTDAIVIFSTVLLAVSIGFFQENKTSKILTELKKIVKAKTYLMRDGNEKEVEQSELVPGDIFLLQPGQRVPADGRLIEAHNLNINESILTGEWISSKKTTEILPENISLADRNNMVYMGCIVEDGRGKSIVTENGIKTEIGKAAVMVRETGKEKTLYQKKVVHFIKVLGLIIVSLCFGIFILGVATGKGYLEMLLISVAIAVAAIPEGLPAAVTVTFAFGVREILKRKGLVRRLIAAETLGSTSIIFTDKTGTLTEAKMQVAGIFPPTARILALKIAILCNEAFIENPDETQGKYILRGRPTEKALLLEAIQAGLNRKKLEKKEPKIDEFFFDPVYKHSATLHKNSPTQNILYVLGAPEKILEMSNFLNINEKDEILSEEKREKLKKEVEVLAEKGQRVLATAYRKYEARDITYKNLKELCNDLTFVGFITLQDPLRKDAREAIKICQQAGMKVIIITGDHKLTAKAIAKELGLPTEEKNIIEGKDLEKMSDKELDQRLKDIEIYARMEPSHKTRIITAWQGKGEIVAMTGDGINDAPALKKANIGVALGSGTEVAKEASDLILLNDNFSIIVTAVEEGRRIMDNIRKIITYLLTGGFTELMLIGLSVIFRLPLPILPGQILWKNLIESTPPSMALTFESKEKEIMNRPPESPKLPLLTKEMNVLIFVVGILTNFILFGLFLWFWYSGFPLNLIRSVMFGGLTIDSFFFIFSCKNLRKNIWQYNPFDNLYLNLTIIFGFIMLGLALYLPIFQKLLKTIGLGFFEWSILLGFGLLSLILIEAAKWYFIKKSK